MKSFLKTNELIEALNNRYAVKKFEKEIYLKLKKVNLKTQLKVFYN